MRIPLWRESYSELESWKIFTPSRENTVAEEHSRVEDRAVTKNLVVLALYYRLVLFIFHSLVRLRSHRWVYEAVFRPRQGCLQATVRIADTRRFRGCETAKSAMSDGRVSLFTSYGVFIDPRVSETKSGKPRVQKNSYTKTRTENTNYRCWISL